MAMRVEGEETAVVKLVRQRRVKVDDEQSRGVKAGWKVGR